MLLQAKFGLIQQYSERLAPGYKVQICPARRGCLQIPTPLLMYWDNFFLLRKRHFLTSRCNPTVNWHISKPIWTVQLELSFSKYPQKCVPLRRWRWLILNVTFLGQNDFSHRLESQNDEACSCSGDWRLSASWGCNWALLEPLEHHSTVVSMCLRGP